MDFLLMISAHFPFFNQVMKTRRTWGLAFATKLVSLQRVYLLQLLHHNKLGPAPALLVGDLPSAYPPTWADTFRFHGNPIVVGAFVWEAIVAIIWLQSISAIELRSSLVGKDIVFRFIIESLRDFGPQVIGLFLNEDFWKMIFWLVLKLEISYRVVMSWRILVSFRGFFENYIFAWWNIWVSIILLLAF